MTREGVAAHGWKCRLLGHKFKYTDQALCTHVVEFCLRCGMRRA